MYWLKHTVVVLLGVCLVAPFAGTWGWLQLEQSQVRKNVKRQILAGMNKADLYVFTFSLEEAAQLDWHHDAEFVYQDQMYDVVDREMRGDSVLFWCWWDVKETGLRKQSDLLALRLGQQAPAESQSTQHLTDFLKTLICTDLPAPVIEYTTFFTPLSGPDVHYSLHSEAPPVPPPDLV